MQEVLSGGRAPAVTETPVHYKIWIQLEEIKRDGKGEEVYQDVGLPDALGTYDSLSAAQRAITGLLMLVQSSYLDKSDHNVVKQRTRTKLKLFVRIGETDNYRRYKNLALAAKRLAEAGVLAVHGSCSGYRRQAVWMRGQTESVFIFWGVDEHIPFRDLSATEMTRLNHELRIRSSKIGVT